MPRQNNIQIRRGTNSEWASANPTLVSGEPAFETDTSRLKIGDGLVAWSGLNYIGSKELLNIVRNDTGATIAAGQALYVSGIYNNSIPSVDKYIANSISENLFIGLAASNISNGSTGYAVSFGQIDNLNTTGGLNNLSVFGETWTNGTLLYAHPTAAGKFTSVKPSKAILVGTVIYAHGTQGKIFVRPKSYELLDDLYDVNTSSVSNNQYLQYNSASSSWTPTSSGVFSNVNVNNNIQIVSSGTSQPNIISFDDTSTPNAYSVGSISNGMRLLLSSNNNLGHNAIGVDYAGNNNTWFSIPSGMSFKFFDGNDTIFSISRTAINYNGSGLVYGAGGTTNYLSKFTGSSRIGNSIIYDDGTNIGIGINSPTANLHVVGNTLVSSGLFVNSKPLSDLPILYVRPVDAAAQSSSFMIQDSSYLSLFDIRNDGNAQIGGIGGQGLTHRFNIKGSTSTSSAAALNIINSSGSNLLFVRNDGNIGIGTTSPAEILEISGSLKFVNCSTRIARGDNNNISFNATTSSAGHYGIYINNTATTNGRNFRLASYADGTNAGSFRLRDDTAGTDRLIVSSAGNLGINADPSDRIHISGSQTTIRLNNSLGYDTQLRFIDTVSDWSVGVNTTNSAGAGCFNIRSNTAGSHRLVIDTNGNVGLGTVSPSTKLEVVATGTTSVDIAHFSNSNGVEKAKFALSSGGDGTLALIDGSNNSNIFLSSNASTNSYINCGNVGIGTTNPGYKLQVSGSFGATTKSFRIDHPSKPGYSLEYGSLESPYHGVRLTGRGKLVKGVGAVMLPNYLKDLIHDDDNLNIQITNIKHGKIIYIDKIDLKNDRFSVKADRAKSLGELHFFWTLTGVRKDVEGLVVEKEN
jgi:hypothetical protein